ncbi:MAG: nitrate/TMAO reductase-like tetraheme cytochrome c subunit [Bradymonadia bacterium]|jgi:nitrate/TMAO reductase-like tetraheme cytochrome c subunit
MKAPTQLPTGSILTAGLVAITALLIAAGPGYTPGPLPVESDWKARAEAWFKDAKTQPERRKAMRQVTKALKQPCRYCHTPDWSGYTDKHLISKQMMAISAEHDVACADCHAGKVEMTALGKTSQTMWALARSKRVDCGHCHLPKAKFKTLNKTGEAWKTAHPDGYQAPAIAAPASTTPVSAPASATP